MRFCGFVRLVRIVESHIRSVGTSFLAVPFIGVRENIHSPGETRHKKACTLENRFFFVFLHSVQWFFDLVFHIIDHFTTSISPNMVNDKEVRMVSTLAFTQNRWILSARRFLETLYDFSLSIDRSIDSFCSVIRPAAFYSHSLCTISSNNTQYIWLWTKARPSCFDYRYKWKMMLVVARKKA